MIAEYEEDFPVQRMQYIIPLFRTSVAEIPQVEHDTVFRYGLIPSTDQFGVHLLGISEWTVTVLYYVLMPEMRIRGEPQPVRLKRCPGLRTHHDVSWLQVYISLPFSF